MEKSPMVGKKYIIVDSRFIKTVYELAVVHIGDSDELGVSGRYIVDFIEGFIPDIRDSLTGY